MKRNTLIIRMKIYEINKSTAKNKAQWKSYRQDCKILKPRYQIYMFVS